jgi:hypothetical protein
LAGLTKEGLKIQLRELTEEELRERADKRASYTSRGGVDPNGLASMGESDYRGGFNPRNGVHVGAHGGAAGGEDGAGYGAAQAGAGGPNGGANAGGYGAAASAAVADDIAF